MARSLKKGPFVDPSLQKKVEHTIAGGSKPRSRSFPTTLVTNLEWTSPGGYSAAKSGKNL